MAYYDQSPAPDNGIMLAELSSVQCILSQPYWNSSLCNTTGFWVIMWGTIFFVMSLKQASPNKRKPFGLFRIYCNFFYLLFCVSFSSTDFVPLFCSIPLNTVVFNMLAECLLPQAVNNADIIYPSLTEDIIAFFQVPLALSATSFRVFCLKTSHRHMRTKFTVKALSQSCAVIKSWPTFDTNMLDVTKIEVILSNK